MKKPNRSQLSLLPPLCVRDCPPPMVVNYDDGKGWQKADYRRCLTILELYYLPGRLSDMLASGDPIGIAVEGRSVYFASPKLGVALPDTFWNCKGIDAPATGALATEAGAPIPHAVRKAA